MTSVLAPRELLSICLGGLAVFHSSTFVDGTVYCYPCWEHVQMKILAPSRNRYERLRKQLYVLGEKPLLGKNRTERYNSTLSKVPRSSRSLGLGNAET
jgi:hypothetical protein